MNLNPDTVPMRQFLRPMTWASDSQLSTMKAELSTEAMAVHGSVRKLAEARNGLLDVEREIAWRLK